MLLCSAAHTPFPPICVFLATKGSLPACAYCGCCCWFGAVNDANWAPLEADAVLECVGEDDEGIAPPPLAILFLNGLFGLSGLLPVDGELGGGDELPAADVRGGVLVPAAGAWGAAACCCLLLCSSSLCSFATRAAATRLRVSSSGSSMSSESSASMSSRRPKLRDEDAAMPG